MTTLPPLISDLSLILLCAAITTVIFKKLKQPLVLGYIVAGFLASPNINFTPSVIDTASIHTWSEIGVIFLLFALGLEFSIKKILKVGGTAIISASTIIFCMICIGLVVGLSFGWKRMDCIYLGGMLAMSSTTIIYKAFEDLGLLKKKFAGIVLSILILEDIVAIILLVLLSTVAVSQNFEGTELMFSMAKLVFFLVLWFVVGIYIIPILLRRAKKFITNEMLLIISLALCFGMAVFATNVGFSAAFGAFIMGSILAETVEAEKIEKLVAPVKDLFGAIFFVSVGMMVDFSMITEYIGPIVIITLAIIFGQAIFGTGGVLLSGQPLKTSIQCGFSLMQIGEFAFIIASLGVSLNVTSNFLYPIVVAVSVITTFLTPYMIRLSTPIYSYVERRLPSRLEWMVNGYASEYSNITRSNYWKYLIVDIIKIVSIYSILSIAVILLSKKFLFHLLEHFLSVGWSNFIGTFITLILIAPFLRAIVMKKNHSIEFRALWKNNRRNRAPLISTILLRFVIDILFVLFVINTKYRASITITIGIAIMLVLVMMFSRWLKKQSIYMERVFIKNLRLRDIEAEFSGKKRPKYADTLLSHDLHISNYTVSADSSWVGKTLAHLNIGRKLGVHVISIIRGNHRINIPGGETVIFPNDNLQIIGTDVQIDEFTKRAEKACLDVDYSEIEKSEIMLNQLPVEHNSYMINHSIREIGFRDKYNCLVVGIEKGNGELIVPSTDTPIKQGDMIWLVGEKENLKKISDIITK